VRLSSGFTNQREGLALDRIENLCTEKGMRMTDQRRVVARVLSTSHDHPDVEELYRRAHAMDPHISIATVYRTVRLFEEAGIIARHDFRDGRSRYEETSDTHHDHLIDMKTGKVIEFVDGDIEALQEAIARKLGYRLVDHRLELYGVPIEAAG
jgi:Fur family ferric uptake transcriptional regulator